MLIFSEKPIAVVQKTYGKDHFLTTTASIGLQATEILMISFVLVSFIKELLKWKKKRTTSNQQLVANQSPKISAETPRS